MERNGRKEKKHLYDQECKDNNLMELVWVKEGQAGALSLAASLW
jgi:hypothetical protein